MRTAIVVMLTVLTACSPQPAERVEAPADSAAGEVSFDLRGMNEAALVVPVTINGEGPYDFVLDTGATLTCVDRSLAEELALPESEGLRGIGAGVATQGEMRLVQVDSVRVGAALVEGLDGCVLDLERMRSVGLEIDGLVGLNFLRSFRVTLDFERRVLILQQP